MRSRRGVGRRGGADAEPAPTAASIATSGLGADDRRTGVDRRWVVGVSASRSSRLRCSQFSASSRLAGLMPDGRGRRCDRFRRRVVDGHQCTRSRSSTAVGSSTGVAVTGVGVVAGDVVVAAAGSDASSLQ